MLNDRLDGLSSNLPFHPAFVTLMQSVLQYFDASVSTPESVTVGSRVVFPGNVQLLNQAGDPQLKRDATGGVSGWQVQEPGLYTIVSARGEQFMQAYLAARESDLSVVSLSEQSAWQDRYTTSDNTPEEATSLKASEETLAEQVSVDVTPIYLWRWILPLLLVVVFFECVFANYRLAVRRDGS